MNNVQQAHGPDCSRNDHCNCPSVDFHNQVPGCECRCVDCAAGRHGWCVAACLAQPEVVVQVRNRCHVEALKAGEVVGRANRPDTESDWQIGFVIKGKMTNCAVIYKWTPEVQARKILLALLKEA